LTFGLLESRRAILGEIFTNPLYLGPAVRNAFHDPSPAHSDSFEPIISQAREKVNFGWDRGRVR